MRSEAKKKYQDKYNQLPEVKEKARAANNARYRNNKEVRERAKIRNAKPEVVAKHKAYLRTARGKRIARNHCNKRRAAKLRRTPSWADVGKIKMIYLQCPVGYEVDHIIPLQGELVSGLHLHENLQYLTKSNNSSKNNRFNPMEHEGI